MEQPEVAGEQIIAPPVIREPEPEPDLCDPALFTDLTKDLDAAYVSILGDSCGACEAFKEDVRKAEAQIPHPIIEVSANQCPRLADHFGARVTPTVVLLKKGQVVGTYEGRDAIEKMKQGI